MVIVCEVGRYGNGCAMTCGGCQDNEACAPDTGLCPGRCQAGLQGPRCDRGMGKTNRSSRNDTHTNTQAHAHACSHTHTYTHTPTPTHKHTCSHTHTRIHTQTHTHTHTHTHTDRPRAHTHTHTHTQTYHAHTHREICTEFYPSLSLLLDDGLLRFIRKYDRLSSEDIAFKS